MEFNNNLEPKGNNSQAIGTTTKALKEVYLSNPSGVVKKVNVDTNNKLNVGSEVLKSSADVQTTITDDDSKIPSSGAVVDYVVSNASIILHKLSNYDTTTTSITNSSGNFITMKEWYLTPTSALNRILQLRVRYQMYSPSYQSRAKVVITDNSDNILYEFAEKISSTGWVPSSDSDWDEIELTLENFEELQNETLYKIKFTHRSQPGTSTNLQLRNAQVEVLYCENVLEADLEQQ